MEITQNMVDAAEKAYRANLLDPRRKPGSAMKAAIEAAIKAASEAEKQSQKNC